MNRYIVHLLLILFYIFLQDYAQKLVSTNRCSQWKRGQLNEHAHCWNHLLLIWICFLWASHGHRKNQFIGFAFRESPTNMKDVKCTNGRSHSSYMQCKLSLHCLLITSFNWMDMRLNIFQLMVLILTLALIGAGSKVKRKQSVKYVTQAKLCGWGLKNVVLGLHQVFDTVLGSCKMVPRRELKFNFLMHMICDDKQKQHVICTPFPTQLSATWRSFLEEQ